MYSVKIKVTDKLEYLICKFQWIKYTQVAWSVIALASASTF